MIRITLEAQLEGEAAKVYPEDSICHLAQNLSNLLRRAATAPLEDRMRLLVEQGRLQKRAAEGEDVTRELRLNEQAILAGEIEHAVAEAFLANVKIEVVEPETRCWNCRGQATLAVKGVEEYVLPSCLPCREGTRSALAKLDTRLALDEETDFVRLQDRASLGGRFLEPPKGWTGWGSLPHLISVNDEKGAGPCSTTRH